MSANTKKRLTVYSIITVLLISGFALYMLMRQSTSQENVEEGGNVETPSSTPTLISKTKTENEDARSAYSREHVVEKIYEYINEETQETVRDIVKTKIIEVGSGLNYFDATENKWKPSNPHFVDMGSYYQLVESAYEVVIPKNLGVEITYNVDGTPLGLQFKHIVVSDGENSTTLNVPANIMGTIDANNTSIIKFADVWTGIDVEYHAGKGKFQQDIIIKDKTSLSSDSVNLENAKAYFYTALDLTDYTNNGINMKIDGNAVDIAAGNFRNTESSKDAEIVFIKNNENVPLHILSQSPVYDSQCKEIEKAERQIYKDNTTGTIYFVEAVDHALIDNGVVLDYNMISGTISEETIWTADATYYVSSDINLGAELAIEPGTVIKFNEDSAINVNSGGEIHAVGEPYKYIVFTSKTDDDSGEDLTDTSTSGTSGYYDEAIYLTSNASADSRVSYCKIGYGTYGIRAEKTLSESARLENNIIYNSSYGLYLYSAGNTAQNNLIWSCSVGINMVLNTTTSQALNIYNNTIDDSSNNGMYIGLVKSGSITIKDNILSNCAYGIWRTTGGTIINDYNAYYGNTNDTFNLTKGANSLDDTYDFTQPIYDTSTLGDYYINDTAGGGALLWSAGSRYASTAGLDGEEFTWKAPTEAPTTINGANTSWTKVAATNYGSTDNVTIGYHHNRVDYILNDQDTTVTTYTLTINPGVVVTFRTTTTSKYLKIYTDATLICQGDTDDKILFTNYETASMDIKLPDYPDSNLGIVSLQSVSSANSKVDYTEFSGLGYGLAVDKALSWTTSHCVFSDNYQGFRTIKTNVISNNLFYRNATGLYGFFTTSGGAQVGSIYSNTFDENEIGLDSTKMFNGSGLIVKDNLFTQNGTGFKESVSGTGTVLWSYNAYWCNEENITNSSGVTQGISSDSLYISEYDDVYEDDWQDDWEWDKRWYLLQDGTDFTPCIDGGSRNVADAGLDAFYTTKYSTDNWPDVETVDIGYHYPLDITGISSQDIDNVNFNDDTNNATIDIDFSASENWGIIIYDSSMTQIDSESSTGSSISTDSSNWTLSGDGTYIVKVYDTDGTPSFSTFYFYIHRDSTAPTGVTIEYPITDEIIICPY